MKEVCVKLATLLFVLLIATQAFCSQINLNTVSARRLAQETGINYKQAALVIMYRNANGSIISYDDLRGVPGIDQATVDQLQSDAGIYLGDACDGDYFSCHD